jgi:flagellar assembly factor FliW
LKLTTHAFGTLEYEERAVLHIREGMLGFVQFKRYLLIENEDILPFKWLQSVDDQYVSFPVIDPHLVVRDYEFAITLEDLRNLEINDQADVVTLAVAVIPQDPIHTTVNLKAPVVINHQRMIGKQVVLTHSDYHTQQPLVFSGK